MGGCLDGPAGDSPVADDDDATESSARGSSIIWMEIAMVVIQPVDAVGWRMNRQGDFFCVFFFVLLLCFA